MTPSMQAEISFRRASPGDIAGIVELYRAVAAQGSGLARGFDEITPHYVGDFVEAASSGGLEVLAIDGSGCIVAEIHARPLGPRVFSHVLGDLTIAVHPSSQRLGIGRRLFEEFLDTVSREMPHISRVELKARETNARAIAMYESLGFEKEGRMRDRIRLSNGSLDADIPMAWHRVSG